MTSYAENVLPQLRKLPPPLAALLLQQANRYEVMFPREQRELTATLDRLRPPRDTDAEQALQSFRALHVPADLRLPNWETEPAIFAEAFTAAMWSSGQIAAFRDAARRIVPAENADDNHVARAVVIVFDADLQSPNASTQLFRRLRPAGMLYTRVSSAGARQHLQTWMGARALASPERYGHWFISGARSSAWELPASVVKVAYGDLRPARLQLLRTMNRARYEKTGGGPEGLRSAMLEMHAADMGMEQAGDPVLQSFAADVLVGGSGTQLYSTTFVQWSLREALRRARPQTVLANFSARNGSASMDVRLSNPEAEPAPDPAGSLLDAEMHTYMTYINLLRLPSKQSTCLAWHPGYGQALLIAPHVAAGSTVTNETGMNDLLARVA